MATISPAELMNNQTVFTIADCSGKYYLKRLNEFGDCVIMCDNSDGWMNAGTIELKRKGEMKILSRQHGITLEKRVKYSKITLTNEVANKK